MASLIDEISRPPRVSPVVVTRELRDLLRIGASGIGLGSALLRRQCGQVGDLALASPGDQGLTTRRPDPHAGPGQLTVLTESAAILIHLSLHFPASGQRSCRFCADGIT